MGTQTRSTKNRKDRKSCSYRTSQEADESRAGADISYIHVFLKANHSPKDNQTDEPSHTNLEGRK